MDMYYCFILYYTYAPKEGWVYWFILLQRREGYTGLSLFLKHFGTGFFNYKAFNNSFIIYCTKKLSGFAKLKCETCFSAFNFFYLKLIYL